MYALFTLIKLIYFKVTKLSLFEVFHLAQMWTSKRYEPQWERLCHTLLQCFYEQKQGQQCLLSKEIVFHKLSVQEGTGHQERSTSVAGWIKISKSILAESVSQHDHKHGRTNQTAVDRRQLNKGIQKYTENQCDSYLARSISQK